MGERIPPPCGLLLACVVLFACGDSPAPVKVGPFELEITTGGPGRVEGLGSTCEGACVESYPTGSVVGLEAVAGEGARFVGWSGHCGGAGVCEVVMDRDRDVRASFAKVCPEPWSVSLGQGVEPLGVALDGEGGSVVVGRFEGRVDIAGLSLTSKGGADGFVARFDGASCGLAWALGVGGEGEDSVVSVALDGSGNPLIAGVFEGSVALGSTSLRSLGGADLFLAKLAGANGGALWAVRAGGRGQESGAHVAVDAAGNRVLWGGDFEGLADAAGRSIASEGGTDVFVARLDGTAGGAFWARAFGGPGDDVLGGFSVVEGDPLIVGAFEGRFEPGGLRGHGERDMFVARLDKRDGLPLWASAVGSGQEVLGTGIAPDGEGGALVAGVFVGTIEVDGVLLGGEAPHQLLARLDAQGSLSWARAFEGAVQGPRLVGGGALVWVAGALTEAVDLGEGLHEPSGPSELFLAGFGVSEGELVEAITLGNEGIGELEGLAVGSGQEALLVGRVEGGAAFLGGGSGGFVLRVMR